MASRLWVAALGLALAASLSGCVSIPSGGPVQASTVTAGPGGQSQRNVQFAPQPPVNGWSPQEIVTGFLLASASFGDQQQTALEYLTPKARIAWRKRAPWSAIVYSNEPDVSNPRVTVRQRSTSVTVKGTVLATLSGNGGYAVPSASASKPKRGQPQDFELERAGGQWRISQAPQELLLTSYLFDYDYQLRNLYFFDPTKSFLVPDPVYVPLQETPVDLLKGLVNYLIKPPPDWLSHATTTAFANFPDGTSIADVTVTGGTATVNLSVPPKAAPSIKQQLQQQASAQLLYTLSGSGQGGSVVQSVELSVNGTPFIPPGQQDPVQQLGQAKYGPPMGSGSKFYYLDGESLLQRDVVAGTTTQIARLGKGYSQIAVSPGPEDSQYVAALKGGILYAGPLHGKLTRQHGSGYQTMSWDAQGDLWTTTTSGQIVMLSAPDNPGQPLGQPVQVSVSSSNGLPSDGAFNALRVAPDGVRVAIIVGGSDLVFGAIVPPPPSTRASQPAIKIDLSPFTVSLAGNSTFSEVTWYGADNVITLGEPSSVLTEYPVNGGSSTSVAPQANLDLQSITVSYSALTYGDVLVGGLAKGGLEADQNLTGPFAPVPGTKKALSPVYPG